MQAVVGEWIRELKYFWFREIDVQGIPVVLSRTGWSNERGYEIFLRDGSRGDELWEILMQAGTPWNISPACTSQIKRIEAGLLSYRTDMDLSTNPFEVGLGKYVDLEQDADFIGNHALKAIVRAGVRNRLLGACIDGAPLPVNEHRWTVCVDGKPAGELTSCCYSPSLERNLAYIYLPSALAKPGRRVSVLTVAGERTAELCELPFVRSRATERPG